MSFTFNNLSSISGISSMNYSHSSGSKIITYGVTISGNTVSLHLINYTDDDDNSVSVSITAFQI